MSQLQATATTQPQPQTATKSTNDYNLSHALNYGHAAGSPALLRFITEHIELVHNPPTPQPHSQSHGEPSYLSLDPSGRTIRLDSTSKILAPGLRAGWITAPAPIITKFLAYQENTTVAVSGPSQLMLYHLLDQTWGHQGFFTWLEYLSERYRVRPGVLVRVCERYLPREVCAWVVPECGMFVWVQVGWGGISFFEAAGGEVRRWILDVEERVVDGALRGVQVTKGSLFCVEGGRGDEELHFRMTFAVETEGGLVEGVRRFAEALREEFALG
ncbi:PLP-dependent transferase [Aspergillus ellipticus CBS 707.79]|uniref:PLP-dependent transferase n=1 Tax=Aspergillus ellipticus CBS 707.79 TaxID=1448320 RepID=A0A319DL42_9EURO|nr:PLP-dependent transferase [Aspergillus ellipticus CBS 707.79]